MEKITEILDEDQQIRQAAAESIKVTKLLPLDCYPKDLLIVDTNEINMLEYRKNPNDYLRTLTRDCVQHLVNSICGGEREIIEGKEFIRITGPAYSLPREKPIPAPKSLTKWQKFALEKGINKKKKPSNTWDDVLQRWVPTHGYKKVAAEKEKDWLLEVPSNVDPNTDMFAEKSKTKKENVAKNEFQRLRNIASSKKIKVPKVAVPPMEANLHTSQLQVAADVARIATASLGKFQPKLPHEKELKQPRNLGNKKKRKFLSSEDEKKANLDIAEKILKKKPKIDLNKAVNRQIYEEETQRHEEKIGNKKGKKRKWTDPANSKKGGKNSFKRPKGLKGQRARGKQGTGRKRR